MIDFQQQQKNILVGLFPDSCNSKAKTKGQAIKHRMYPGYRALWRGLTKFSAHCVVCGGSPVLRSIPPSRPLQLALAFVLPAARPVFKWATHKFQTGVIGYKRGNRVELRRVRYQCCKTEIKITAAPWQMPGMTTMSSTAMNPLLVVHASMSSWACGGEKWEQ